MGSGWCWSCCTPVVRDKLLSDRTASSALVCMSLADTLLTVTGDSIPPRLQLRRRDLLPAPCEQRGGVRAGGGRERVESGAVGSSGSISPRARRSARIGGGFDSANEGPRSTPCVLHVISTSPLHRVSLTVALARPKLSWPTDTSRRDAGRGHHPALGRVRDQFRKSPVTARSRIDSDPSLG